MENVKKNMKPFSKSFLLQLNLPMKVTAAPHRSGFQKPVGRPPESRWVFSEGTAAWGEPTWEQDCSEEEGAAEWRSKSAC